MLSVSALDVKEAANNSYGVDDTEFDTSAIFETSEPSNVNDIISRIGSLRAKQIHSSTTINTTYSSQNDFSSDIDALETELINLGVRELCTEEVAALFQINDETTNQRAIEIPSYKENITWYIKEYYHIYRGQRYLVTHVYAQGKNLDSVLCDQDLDLNLKTTGNHIIDGTKEFISFAFSFATEIANVDQEVSWLPVDFLLYAGDSAEDIEYEVRYTYVTTICFSHVKKVDTSEEDDLCYYSSQVHISGDNTAMGVVNGQPYNHEEDFDFTISAPGYASAERACAAHLYVSEPYQSFVDKWVFTSFAGTHWNTVYFPRFTSMGLLY